MADPTLAPGAPAPGRPRQADPRPANADSRGSGAGWRALAGRWHRRLHAAAPALALDGDARRVPSDALPGPVDVIVPVHGAAEALDRCLAALAAHTGLGRHRLLLVLDGPQPAAVAALLTAARLARLAPPAEASPLAGEPGMAGEPASGPIEVLQQAARRGFVASVNRGMTAGSRDVVLLNSDTRVTAGWLEKLQQAAYSAPEIATATPFSNSATICSLPRFLESNALPAGWDVDGFGRLVEERSTRARPRLPTGVGVCLYIKRKALDQLGLFNERSFGLGYGEESEFCMRALKAGYAHVLDDATFIFHEGHRSFGVSRRSRVAAAHRQLATLHPEYLSTVARFVREDPLRPLRERVTAALLPPRRPARPGSPARVLHVVHGWPPWSPAGTEMYAAWLARRQAAHREVTVLSRIADPGRGLGDAIELLDHGARVRLLVRNFDERDPRSRNALTNRAVERAFASLLAEVAPQLVHVHHLAGHAASLVGMARRRGIPVLYQIQDWWTPCARANLLDRERRLCSGPAPAKCTACLPLTGLPPAPLLNRLLYRYRGAATRRALRGAAAYVMGSRFIRDSYLELGLLRHGDAAHVLRYGVELTPRLPRPPRPAGAPLRCGVIGSILPHKGIHVAAAAFAGFDPRQAHVTIWGDPSIDPAYTRELIGLGATEGAAPAADPPPVLLAGRFEEERKAAIFAALDLLLIPSLGLESFGLVAREALHHGVPVLASRRGALSEIFPPSGSTPPPAGALHAEPYGALFEAGDAGALRRWIERLIAEPALLAGWQSRLPPVQGADEHADEIEEIYCRLLAGDLGPAGSAGIAGAAGSAGALGVPALPGESPR